MPTMRARLVENEPMTKLLRAQAAQLAGDRQGAIQAYNAMLDHHETYGLGLRGLHIEARRGGDHDAALQYAMRANAHAPAAWAGQAVLGRPRAARRLGRGVDDRRFQRRGGAHRQADGEPVARGDQDRDGGGEDGARSEGCARPRPGGLSPCADARARGGDLRTPDCAAPATSAARRRSWSGPMRRRRTPISPPRT